MQVNPNSGNWEIFACGIRNPGLWNPEYRIRNPTIDWNPESKFHWQKIEITWNPESKAVVDSLSWAKISLNIYNQICVLGLTGTTTNFISIQSICLYWYCWDRTLVRNVRDHGLLTRSKESAAALEGVDVEVRIKKQLASPIHRGYYTVAWRYEFYFQWQKQYFTNERS